MDNAQLTVALSLLVHGEAVRFNRGKSRGDDFDFKYMLGPKGIKYPYVSSQCFKKYWRETLPKPFSPITRGKNIAGAEKNQAYTDGNPIIYIDDDLFGYMVAGAESPEEPVDEEVQESLDEIDAALDNLMFSEEDITDRKGLLRKFKEGSGKLYDYLKERIPNDQRTVLDEVSATTEPSDELLQTLLNTLNEAIRDAEFPLRIEMRLKRDQKKALDSGDPRQVGNINRDILLAELKKELVQAEKRKTTRRTAPIRMHALVAFSGIKLAKDFQTFSRDIAYTGKNSILNPNPVGIYSGWLKARVLIEGHRIGKFYLGENRDILAEQAEAWEKQRMIDPYSRRQEQIEYIQLDTDIRTTRLRQALEALANIGNLQGPASGALHDGSLKPRGFIGAFMKCADSPFDAVWRGTDDLPYFDRRRLNAVLQDWSDLFASRKIYIGLPIESEQNPEEFKAALDEDMAGLDFEFIVQTPRQALLKMARDAKL